MARRDTWDSGPAPHFQRSGIVEVARHLLNTVRRFLAGKATQADVDAAIQLWQSERPKVGQR